MLAAMMVAISSLAQIDPEVIEVLKKNQAKYPNAVVVRK